RAQRADRTDDHLADCVAEAIFETKPANHFEKIVDLVRARKEQHVHGACENLPDRIFERTAVVGQLPAIHGNLRDESSAALELTGQIVVGDTVLLDRDSRTAKLDRLVGFVERQQQLTPGVRLRDRDRDRYAEL